MTLSLLWAGAVWAQDASEEYVALDIFVFRQSDAGGNPYQSEGLDYYSNSVDFRVELSEDVALRGNVVGAFLQNDDLADLPSTIANADVTSASPDFTTLDASMYVDVKLGAAREWTLSPGAYYHHQWGFVSGGADFRVTREFFGGDTVLAMNYSGRISRIDQNVWDGSTPGLDKRITNNILFLWTQHISPSWIAMLGLQYTREDGLLHSTLQYVVLFDAQGTPRLLVDENLPDKRNRFQANARLKYSPSVGHSFGLDSSIYYDDWDILHTTIQPSMEMPIFADIRWQIWFRTAFQRGTQYFQGKPLVQEGFQTQDSDLAGFIMYNPGMVFIFPLSRCHEQRWEGRFALYGFYRDDNVFTLGSNLGLVTTW